jgi:hypothetical protein
MPLEKLAFNSTAEVPPVPGRSFWRINFSRVEYHVEAESGRSANFHLVLVQRDQGVNPDD